MKNSTWKLKIIMGIIILSSLFPRGNIAYAESNSNYEYKIKNKEITINKYVGSSTYINVPSSIDNIPVTSIGEEAFAYTDIKTVRIPNSIENISKGVFTNCDKLTGVIIGNGVTKIPENTFNECVNLKYVILGKNVIEINNAFFSLWDSYDKLQYISILNKDCSFDEWMDNARFTICTKPDSIIAEEEQRIVDEYNAKYEEKKESYDKYYSDDYKNYDEYFNIEYGYEYEEENDDGITVETEDYVDVAFVDGDKTLFTASMVKTGTILMELYHLENTSKQTFVGWYTSASFKEKVDKIGDMDITVYAKFENKPVAPAIKVTKKSDTEYKITWEKKEGYYYQVETKYANYLDSKYKVLQKYKKDINSYTAKVSGKYDKYFRIKCYKVIDGIKVYSDYSQASFSSKPSYPSVYIAEYSLSMNYLGGIDNYIQYYNNSSKNIKYIVFTANAYNRVNDRITNDIGRNSSFRMRDVGPLAKNESGGGTWKAVWYNSTTSYSKIIKIEIEYMDGTKKTINVNVKSN